MAQESLMEDLKEETRHILRSWIFDIIIGSIIALNAVSISIEQTLEIEGRDTTAIKVCESVFLTIYIFELALRFFGFGLSALRESWVKFDIILVALGILQSWILEIVLDDDNSLLGPVMLLRSARLLRLTKTVRMLSHVQEFWMLIRGLLNSASIMLYTFAILFLVLFIFSSVAVELITKNSLATSADFDPEFRSIVERHFNSIPNSMMTLLQFACMDRIAEIYRPLVLKDGWLAIYFIVLIVVCMVLAALIAAVIFSTTMAENDAEIDVAKRLQETKWSELFGNMREMFVRIDSDKTGVISRENCINMAEDDKMALADALKVTDKSDIYRILDREKKGYVTINEFFDRILDSTMNQGSVGLTRMERQIECMHWRSKEGFSALHDLHFLLKQAIMMLDNLQPSIEQIQHSSVESKDAIKRLSVGGESIFALADSRRLSLAPSLISQASPVRKSLVSFAELNRMEHNGTNGLSLEKDLWSPRSASEKQSQSAPSWVVEMMDGLADLWQERMQDILDLTRDHLQKTSKVRSRKLSPDGKAVSRSALHGKKNGVPRPASPGSDCVSVNSDVSFQDLMRAAKQPRSSPIASIEDGFNRQLSPGSISSIASAELESNLSQTSLLQPMSGRMNI